MTIIIIIMIVIKGVCAKTSLNPSESYISSCCVTQLHKSSNTVAVAMRLTRGFVSVFHKIFSSTDNITQDHMVAYGCSRGDFYDCNQLALSTHSYSHDCNQHSPYCFSSNSAVAMARANKGLNIPSGSESEASGVTPQAQAQSEQ